MESRCDFTGKSVEEKSRMRSVRRESCPVARWCEQFGAETSENHLRAALIRPGGSRYEQKEVAARKVVAAMRVEPRSRKGASLAIEMLQGTFYVRGPHEKGVGRAKK